MKICSSIIENKIKYDSYFDKQVKDYIILKIKFVLICVLTLGIGYPWALCMEYKVKSHHTVICGRRLKFIGKPSELIFHWLFWWLLSIITFGLFLIVTHVRMDQWITANTIFEDVEIK
ncbi:membrane protein [Clostridium sardiniense]|uniref:hypothetical protein n=1 Tax=Clostridium sardiniense TaxID=29369 RepID=UPI00195CC0AA|nr:hypothetical protein [Clostridium sardiniense]MBM7833333.1 uncharacterized membrane protein YjgN (DUF898 family) [Clostridium sardiniense]